MLKKLFTILIVISLLHLVSAAQYIVNVYDGIGAGSGDSPPIEIINETITNITHNIVDLTEKISISNKHNVSIKINKPIVGVNVSFSLGDNTAQDSINQEIINQTQLGEDEISEVSLSTIIKVILWIIPLGITLGVFLIVRNKYKKPVKKDIELKTETDASLNEYM